MRRRLACMPVSAEFLLLLSKGEEIRRVELVAGRLPPDTTIVRMGHDPFGWINLIIESASFDEVTEDGPIPTLPSPEFRVVRD